MREVQASDAKARFAQLLDDVEGGETIAISRHGRTVAQLVPDAQSRRADMLKAVEEIKAARKHASKITVEELLSARHEGHKY